MLIPLSGITLRGITFVVDLKLLQLVTGTTSKNKPQGNMLLFKAWGCARDPMLREFLVNTDPKAGLAQGSRPYFAPALVNLLNKMDLP